MMARRGPCGVPGGAVCPAIAYDRLLTYAYKLRRGFFGRAANLADHHNGPFGFRIVIEEAQRVKWVVPMRIAPPMPIAVDWPMPRCVN